MTRRCVAVAAATALLSWALSVARLPSPQLFAGLIVALGYALLAPRSLNLPEPLLTGAQAALGVSIGTLVEASTFAALADHWLPVVAVSVATVLVSMGAGLLLGRHRATGRATGVFSMVAGGAAGVTAIARDLGADDRQVAVVQYLRVLIIVVTAPVIARVAFQPAAGSVAPPPVLAHHGWAWGQAAAWGVALLLGCGAGGLILARVTHLPAGTLLGPMILASVATVSGVASGVAVPAPVMAVSFALIGLQVGLRFTRASLRAVAEILPAAVGLILALIVVCAGFGLLLSAATGLSALDGYLATTPGGLYAVVATAIGSGADAAFVLSVQVLRLLLVLLAAPLLARVLAERSPRA